MLLQAVGRDRPQIAMALGLSVPTLRKHYFSELKRADAAAYRLEAAILSGLAREAENGSVAAMRELDRLRQRAKIELADRLARGEAGTEPAQPQKSAPKGKKEQALDAAQSAGAGDPLWADVLPGITKPN